MIPDNCPKPLVREVYLRMFVNLDHATDETTRRSRTGYFIYMNSALVNWLSKKQATIETYVFGAEFVAMKQGMEAVPAAVIASMFGGVSELKGLDLGEESRHL